MSTFEIVIAVFLGIMTFALNVGLMYGALVFWQEWRRGVSVVFFLTSVGMTVAYMVTLLNRVFG